jgi:tetratricopeptide (TPR) repeat protein
MEIRNLQRWWAVRENNVTVFFGVPLLAALITPLSLERKLWLFAIYAMIIVVVWTQRVTMNLALHGRYNWALWLNEKIPQMPGHGPVLHAWILIEAGRYNEARSRFTTHLAFDSTGQPILTDIALYLHAFALLNEHKQQEAQGLLEMAANVPQELPHFYIGLADCLLMQNKDAEQALELLVSASSKSFVVFSIPEERMFRSQIACLNALALACLSRRADAEMKLQEAFASFGLMNKHDQAGILHLKGLTLEKFGERELARSAFKQALETFPFGGAATRASEALAMIAD